MLTVAAAFILLAPRAYSATYQVTPTFARAFDLNFNPLNEFDLTAPTAAAVIQVDFVLSYEGDEGAFEAGSRRWPSLLRRTPPCRASPAH
jgi:hypothetical protein